MSRLSMTTQFQGSSMAKKVSCIVGQIVAFIVCLISSYACSLSIMCSAALSAMETVRMAFTFTNSMRRTMIAAIFRA